MSNILIYFANNAANAGMQAVGSAVSGKVRRALYAGALVTPPLTLTAEDTLRTEGSRADNDIWLSVDGVNYENADIHIVGAHIDVTKKNNIKTTALANRAGTVKERIQQDDYAVKISGNLCTDTAGKFPYQLLKQLNGILSHAGSIYVASAYLDIFDITMLAFKNAEFNQGGSAYFNVMPFSLTFDSDMDYSFLVDEG